MAPAISGSISRCAPTVGWPNTPVSSRLTIPWTRVQTRMAAQAAPGVVSLRSCERGRRGGHRGRARFGGGTAENRHQSAWHRRCPGRSY
jgi:hypothetical protein